MRKNRRFVPLNLNENIVGHLTLLFSLSEEAQAFASEIADDTFSIRLSIDLEPNGHHRGSPHGPPDLTELFATLNLQARCDLVADGYNVRNLKAIDVTAVSQESVDSLTTALELCSESKVLELMWRWRDQQNFE